jgi:hypothetical protein
MRELHDTLLQGFLGASMLLDAVVEQTPANSPTMPSLSRALRLVQQAIEEGRAVIRGSSKGFARAVQSRKGRLGRFERSHHREGSGASNLRPGKCVRTIDGIAGLSPDPGGPRV